MSTVQATAQRPALRWSKHRFPTTLTSSVCAPRWEFSTFSATACCSCRQVTNRRSNAPQASSTPSPPTALRNSSENVFPIESAGPSAREDEPADGPDRKLSANVFPAVATASQSDPLKAPVSAYCFSTSTAPAIGAERAVCVKCISGASERMRQWGGGERVKRGRHLERGRKRLQVMSSSTAILPATNRRESLVERGLRLHAQKPPHQHNDEKILQVNEARI